MRSEAPFAEIRRRLTATPERVFAAFSDATLLSRWLTPSAEIAMSVLAFDFRVGGSYRFAYHVPDGTVMIVNGTYLAIESPGRIAFSWNIEPPDEHAGLQSEVVVSIRADAAGSELHIRHSLLTLPGAEERHSTGWLGALDLLDVLLNNSTYEEN